MLRLHNNQTKHVINHNKSHLATLKVNSIHIVQVQKQHENVGSAEM